MPEAREELQGVVYGSHNPLARMQALCTLDGLGALKPEVLAAALRDDDPAVRRQAVRIAEAKGDVAEVVEAAAKLVDDPDPRVRLQLACSLGEWQATRAGEILGRLAARDADDLYIAAGVVSSASKHYKTVVDALLAANRPAGGTLFRGLLQTAIASNDRETTKTILTAALKPRDGAVAAAPMALFADWLDMPGAALADVMPAAADALTSARAVAADGSAPPDRRAAAARLLGRQAEHLGEDLDRLANLLTPQTPGDVQRAAATRIAGTAAPDVSARLLKGWPGYAPDVRGRVADLLLGREEWAAALLDAVEKQQVSPADIDVPRRQRLLESKSGKIKQRAQSLLGGETATNRQKVVEAHRPVLSMIDKADGGRGATLFAQNCAVCHRVADAGQDVGPDLASVRGWTPEMLLTGVLDPNRQVDPKYVAYTVTLNSGETVYGVITAETGSSLTMKGLDGKDRPVVRADVKSITSTGKSLMPDGFESAMKDQELADLLLFVKAPDGVK
jgi:putative heme-binding domain-containing protein